MTSRKRPFNFGAQGEQDELELEGLEPSNRQREKRSHMRGAPKPTAPRSIRWEIVPAGTVASTCKGKDRGGRCEADVYWIERPRAGRNAGVARLPIDCDGARVLEKLHEGGAYPPTADVDGLGVSHFLTCPDARQF